MVSATDVGGTASTLAFLLDTEQARSDFASQFERDFGKTVLNQLDSEQTASGSMPYGAIVAVGCDAPESVQIDAGEAGLEVTPQLPKKTVQCFAPMTFVVVFAAPAPADSAPYVGGGVVGVGVGVGVGPARSARPAAARRGRPRRSRWRPGARRRRTAR